MGETCTKCCNPNTNEFKTDPTSYPQSKEYPKQYPDDKKSSQPKEHFPANPIEDHTSHLKKVIIFPER
jgi:hypothetical protein